MFQNDTPWKINIGWKLKIANFYRRYIFIHRGFFHSHVSLSGCSFRDGYPCCLLHLAQHRGLIVINFCEAFDSTTTRSVMMGYQFTIGWLSFWVDSCVQGTRKKAFFGCGMFVWCFFFGGGGLKNDPRFLGGFLLKEAIRRIVSLTRTSCFRTESKRKPSEQ